MLEQTVMAKAKTALIRAKIPFIFSKETDSLIFFSNSENSQGGRSLNSM